MEMSQTKASSERLFGRMCRACMAKEQNFQSIRDLDRTDRTQLKICDMLQTAVPLLHIHDDDQLPELICSVCLNKLNIAYHFQAMCIETDKRLRAQLLSKGMAETQAAAPLTANASDTTATIQPDPLLENKELILLDCLKLEIGEENVAPSCPEDPLLTDTDSDSSESDERPDERNRRRGHFPCSDCDKTFDCVYRLRRHAVLHSANRPFQCEICKYRFETKNKLFLHKASKCVAMSKRNRLPPVEGYKCLQCPRRFEKRESLSEHTKSHRKVGGASETLRCQHCQQEFKKLRALVKHVKTHPQGQLKCHICSKSFPVNAQLIEHLNKHNTLKSFVCVDCVKSFQHNSIPLLAEHTDTGRKNKMGIPAANASKEAAVPPDPLWGNTELIPRDFLKIEIKEENVDQMDFDYDMLAENTDAGSAAESVSLLQKHASDSVCSDSDLSNSRNCEFLYDSSSGTEDAVAQKKEKDTELLRLLQQFEMVNIFPDLTNAGVTFKSLKYLNRDDITDAIQNVGHRAEFREKLFHWQKLKFGMEDDKFIAVASKIDEEYPSSSNVAISNTFLPVPKFLLSCLRADSKGRDILQYYKENFCLKKKQRNEIIQVILEDVERNDKKLRPEHFKSIMNEIIDIFPTEKENQDYYYIPRQGKKNPSGKLYSKYFNFKTKTRKQNPSTSLNEIPDAQQSSEVVLEVDKMIAFSLKAILKIDTSNWDEVTDQWQKTFTLRREDLNSLSNAEFLLEWPKLKESKAPLLINLDFNLLYPAKDKLLKSNWIGFKEKINDYYHLYIRNQQSRELFIQAKESKSVDCEDYIFTILLNSVLVPSARFKSEDGSKRKKVSIQDANEGFVLEVECINDYFIKIDELIGKYKTYDSNLTIQPFIIVEGSVSDSLKSFYVHFDKSLYKLNSFLDCLDLCFKIFRVLNLKYPKVCELPWIFIQKYFYNINTAFDVKNSNLTSLLSFMRN